MTRRTRKTQLAKLNIPDVTDIIIANAIVRIAPDLLSKFVPVTPQLQTIVGVGAGFLVGSFFKKPMIANAAIATGAVDMVVPFVEDMVGTSFGVPVAGVNQIQAPTTQQPVGAPVSNVADYLTLNDYVDVPNVTESYPEYMSTYL